MAAAKEKVVYLLGAGFSAPLGLPTMKNFLEVSRDLYFGDTKKYMHFESVLKTIQTMTNALTHYKLDLFNIEDVLSILEMEDEIGGKTEKQRRSSDFAKYIKSVIEAKSPTPKGTGYEWRTPGPAYYRKHFGPEGHALNSYGAFASWLSGLEFVGPPTRQDNIIPDFYLYRRAQQDTDYYVVTLNWDRVLESLIEYIPTILRAEGDVSAAKLNIAKLHGSVDGDIVAPTWRKWAFDSVKKAWQHAHHWLSHANHLRIIGYSLPESDAYVRYLLASAAMKSQHLKRVDIIDRDEAVGQRFDEFISYRDRRFRKGEVRDYLDAILDEGCHPMPHGGQIVANFSRLEQAHNGFMEGRL